MNKYRNTPRTNYMSLSDQCQDLSTEYLVKKVGLTKRLNDQMTIMNQLEKRNEMMDDDFMELLETCNGI
jgi:hypothetical protein